jgi:hypothetical protein
MSTAAVSSLSIFQELQSFYQNRQTDLKQLGSALQSGDLAGAQQAYRALAVLGEGGPFANSEPFAKSSRAQAFNALGEALQAGDLARAQASFATLTGNQGNSATSAQVGSAATPASVVNLTGAQPSNSTATDNASSIYQQLQAFRQQRFADLAQLGQALQTGDLAGAQSAFNVLTALGQTGPNQNGQVFSRADREQDFQAIGKALQSGDLAGKSAFASLSATFGKQDQQAQSAISAYNSGVTEIIINLIPPPSGTGGPLTQPPRFIGPPILQQPPTPPPSFIGPPVVEPPPIQPARFIGPPILQQPLTEPAISSSASTGSTANGSGTSGVPELVINLGGASGTSASGGSTPEIIVNLGQGSSSSREEVTINFGSGSSGAQISIDTTQGQNGSPAGQVTINPNQQNNYDLVLNLFNSISTSHAQNSSSNAVSLHA